MNVPILVIRLHGQRIGQLFQYDQVGSPPIIRFVLDDSVASLPFDTSPVLSESFRAGNPEQQKAFWSDYANPIFNAKCGKHGDWQLPSYFQNLLPEGRFRLHVAEEANIQEGDHIRMLAACGKNLSGAVTAVWEEVPRDQLQRLVTQNSDALEMSVWAEPYQDALSISGVQPKLGVTMDAEGRFVGRTRDGDVHIIAKLPSPDYPRMPQMEDLCMRLAKTCDVDVCDFQLLPLSRLSAPHRYDLGDEVQGDFLAVHRFDRHRENGHTQRIHFEDFAQVLGYLPEGKYEYSYQGIAATLIDLPGCGEAAVLELLRRIFVNDLLGNADMHLKNIGLLYPDKVHATLAPAYDITSTAVYINARGHALHLLDEEVSPVRANRNKTDLLTPSSLRDFCRPLDINEKLAIEVLRDTTALACRHWLPLIMESRLTEQQKRKLVRYFLSRPHAQSWLKRQANAEFRERWERQALA